MKERNDSYLALNIVRVDVGEVVLGKLKSDGQKNVEWVENFAVEGLDIENRVSEPCSVRRKAKPHLGEFLDFSEVVLDYLGVLVFEVAIEL